jgi:hydroxymethylpyrimidine/phosphomethylpyrimidine kinase
VNPQVALTIAGSDSGAGAGLQADLKTFAANGVFGTSVVTAITAQNTKAVLGVDRVDPALVDLQIEAVLGDLPVRAVKTGLLASSATVAAVSRWAGAGKLPNLVVDPVLRSSSGRPLFDDEDQAVRSYLELLFPGAVVVTPNLREASLLTGMAVVDEAAMERAARRLAEEGPSVVVVKGGHLDDARRAPDVVLVGGQVHVLEEERVETANDHGTGCTLSAATAARLALGDAPLDAVVFAKRYVADALAGAAGWHLGAGRGPLDHFGWERGAVPPAGATGRSPTRTAVR